MSVEKRRQKMIVRYEGIVKRLEEQGMAGTDRHTLAAEILQILKDDEAWKDRAKVKVRL